MQREKKKKKKGRKQDKSAAHLEIWRNLFSKAAAEEMSVTYIISVFVRELPGCILFGWIFMSVALFLLMLITYFRIQLSEGESQFRQKEWVGRQNSSLNSLLSGLYP